jgi:hypothetical protein
MQANAVTTPQSRGQTDQARVRALVRFNGLTFHSVAAASFLETAVPAQTRRLCAIFGSFPDVRLWLEEQWWPQRAELGRELRGYVEATWPEFDWSSAYQEFADGYRPRSGLDSGCGTPVLEALALCVAAAQAALFYRALAQSADEQGLRALARRAAGEHAGHFDLARALFERCRRVTRVGPVTAWHAVRAASRSIRDLDVPAAFQPLGRNWNGAPIVPALEYPEYLDRMAHLIQRHTELGLLQRLLFRPWLRREPPAPAIAVPASRVEGRMRTAPQPA